MKNLVEHLKIILNEDSKKPKRHPKCAGVVSHTPDGTEYDCDYNTTITCDECKYCTGSGGRKDPEAACNQLS